MLLVALTALTLTVTVIWVIQPGWVYNLAHGRSHLLDYASSRLEADVGRFFPSSVRPRTATWIWPPAALLLLVGLWWLPGGRRRWANVAGSSGALLAAAALSMAPARVPTRVVEFEDTWIEKQGGSLFPEQWVTNRPRYRGGWTLEPDDELRVPLVVGGRRATVTLDYFATADQGRPPLIEVRAGQRLVARRELVHRGEWRPMVLRDLGWEQGEPLLLALRAGPGDDSASPVVVDRARFTWD